MADDAEQKMWTKVFQILGKSGNKDLVEQVKEAVNNTYRGLEEKNEKLLKEVADLKAQLEKKAEALLSSTTAAGPVPKSSLEDVTTPCTCKRKAPKSTEEGEEEEAQLSHDDEEDSEEEEEEDLSSDDSSADEWGEEEEEEDSSELEEGTPTQTQAEEASPAPKASSSKTQPIVNKTPGEANAGNSSSVGGARASHLKKKATAETKRKKRPGDGYRKKRKREIIWRPRISITPLTPRSVLDKLFGKRSTTIT